MLNDAIRALPIAVAYAMLVKANQRAFTTTHPIKKGEGIRMAAAGRATRFVFRALAIILVTISLSAPGGCAATSTKATLESNLHSSDLSFRSQSCDITARVEWTL